MNEPLRVTVPVRGRPLSGEWIGFAGAFACFVAAGQMLATRVSELYDLLNVELSQIQQLTARHPLALAVVFVALGGLSLATTRVRGPRAGLVRGLVIASALAAIVLTFLGEWTGTNLGQQCLCG